MGIEYRNFELYMRDKSIYRKETTSDNTYGLMCPTCGNMCKCKSHSNYIEYFIDNIELKGIQPVDAYFDTVLLINCKKCGEINQEAIILDGNIYDALYNLNQKGYKTKFSCGGHTITKTIFNHGVKRYTDVSIPYIMFEDIKNFEDLIDNNYFPEGWYVEIHEDLFDPEYNFGSLYAISEEITIPQKDDQYILDEKKLKKVINNLIKWTKNLI